MTSSGVDSWKLSATYPIRLGAGAGRDSRSIGGLRQVRQGMPGPFPVLAVEVLVVHLVHVAPVQAAQVDGEAVRIAARDVERLDPAMAAEQVLGSAGIEGVAAQIICAGQQRETRCRDDQVFEAGHRADGAVATLHQQAPRCLHTVAHTATVTTAFMFCPFHWGTPAGDLARMLRLPSARRKL